MLHDAGDALFLVVWTIHGIPFLNWVPVAERGTDGDARRDVCTHMGRMMFARAAALQSGGFRPEPMAMTHLYRVTPPGRQWLPVDDLTQAAAKALIRDVDARKRANGLPTVRDLFSRSPQLLYERPIGDWSKAAARAQPEITNGKATGRRFR